MIRLADMAFAFGGKKVNVIGVDDGDFLVFQKVNFARVRKQRRNVARDEILAFAQTHDERAFLPRDDYSVGKILAQNCEAVRAFDFCKRVHHCGKNVVRLRIEKIDEMRHHFGVGLAFENRALALKPLLELRMIFDDAVVNDGYRSRNVRLRMRVQIARLAVSRPSRVPDSDRAFYCLVRDSLLQDFERALRLAHDYVFAVEHGNSRRIISAILELFERVNQNRRGKFISDISNNSAHSFLLKLLEFKKFETCEFHQSILFFRVNYKSQCDTVDIEGFFMLPFPR